MIFNAHGERALARIEASLIQSDPGLAAKFERFNTLAPSCSFEEERRARRRARGKVLLALLALISATVFTVWATVSGGNSQGTTGRCATSAFAVCSAGQPRCPTAGVLAGHGTSLGRCHPSLLNAP